jgi:NADH:ubiquinone oxidoreductase subunit 4 (subunit M)
LEVRGVNLVLILLPIAGAGVIGALSAARNQVIRKTAVVTAGLIFAASFFTTKLPLLTVVLRSELTTLEIAVVAGLSGSFFFVMLARGLAAKNETVCALLLVASGLFGILATTLLYAMVAILPLWLLAGTLIRLRGQDGRGNALRALTVAAALCLGFGILALILDHPPLRGLSLWLRGLSLLCLLGAFPFHFWLPRLLPDAPFLLATLAPVVLTRFAALTYARFCPAVSIPTLSVLGLCGIFWCGFASLAADNLREKLGYFVGVQSALAMWAIGNGSPQVALLFLLLTLPATVLWGVGASILYDRLKYLDVDRLHGIGTQLPRMNLLLATAAAGVAFFPGSLSFPGLAILLEKVSPTAGAVAVGAASVLVFLSAGHVYVQIAFGESAEDLRRAGDLNRRELAAVIPVGLCVAAGLWPGLTGVLRSLLP